jgi:hypothetical protein
VDGVGGLLGLLVPAIAGAMVGTLSWVLLSDGREDDGPSGHPSEMCERCGAQVRSDWRLCPHCGSFIEGPDGSGLHEDL